MVRWEQCIGTPAVVGELKSQPAIRSMCRRQQLQLIMLEITTTAFSAQAALQPPSPSIRCCNTEAHKAATGQALPTGSSLTELRGWLQLLIRVKLQMAAPVRS